MEKIKAYKKKNTIENKISLMCYVLNQSLAETEVRALAGIIRFATAGSVTLTIELTKQIRDEYSLSKSALSTSIHRVEKKGLIVRHGKVVTINPLLSVLNDINKIVVCFDV